MFSHYNYKFKSKMVTIHPGEHFTTSEDLIISTILGSCVSVVFHDPLLHIGGMNHFMLSTAGEQKSITKSNSGRYGMYAMELVINALYKNGSRKSSIVAKVFGGGSVLSSFEAGIDPKGVSANNINFAFTYLKNEGIPVLSHDTGGYNGRKIYFYPKTGKVHVSQVSRLMNRELSIEETEYAKNLRKQKQDPKVTLFRNEPEEE